MVTPATYRRRFWVGIGILLVLTPWAIRDSSRALQTMWNAPAFWLPETMEVREAYEEFRLLFSGENVLQISWEGATLDADAVDDAVTALQTLTTPDGDRPAFLADVTSGKSIVESLQAAPAGFSERESINRVKESLVADGDRQTVVIAAYNHRVDDRRREGVAMVRDTVAQAVGVDADEIHVVGSMVDGALIDEEAIRSIERFTTPSTIVGALICFFCLRSVLLTGVVLAIAMVGQGLSLAMVSWAGLNMNAILIVLPPLVFVLTASAGIHLSNYYLDALANHPDESPEQATVRAMTAGRVPCLLAAGTTIVGLGSLTLVQLWPVRAFGAIAGISVALTVGLLLLTLPGAMQWHGALRLRALRRRKQDRVEGQSLAHWRHNTTQSWDRFSGMVMARPLLVVIAFGFITVGAAIGVPQLVTSVNVPRMFPRESQIRRDYLWFEEHLGPTINAEVVVVFDDSATDDALARFIQVARFDSVLRKFEGSGAVISARTFLPTPPKPSSRSLAATVRKNAIRQLVDDPESAVRKTGYIAIAEDGRQWWRISFRFPFGEAIDYRQRMEDVRLELLPVLAEATEGTQLLFTGSVPLTTTSQDVLLSDLFRSFMTAFLIVGVIMILVLRSVPGGILAMFPNLFPTITLFGGMGLLQTPLDIGSVMTASVALGIAVDGTIHLVSRFRSQASAGVDRRTSALRALRQCGPAMWQTTVVCALSPMVYGLSDFIPTQRFAVMMFGLLVSALIGDVCLLPALLASPLGRFFGGKPAGHTPRATTDGGNLASEPSGRRAADAN